jgi:hypothetical protein
MQGKKGAKPKAAEPVEEEDWAGELSALSAL